MGGTAANCLLIEDFRLQISDCAGVPQRNLQSEIYNLKSPHDQNFPHIISGQEKFDGGEVAEQGLNVAVIEDALEAESVANCGVNRSSGPAASLAAQHDGLHL